MRKLIITYNNILSDKCTGRSLQYSDDHLVQLLRIKNEFILCANKREYLFEVV